MNTLGIIIAAATVWFGLGVVIVKAIAFATRRDDE